MINSDRGKYHELSDRDQILQKPGMFMGPISCIEYNDYVINNNIIQPESISYSRGWLKIFDEVIVNACDQWQQHPGQVDIYVTFDKGEITVKNTGPGFEIYLKRTTDNTNIYTPEFCTTRTKAGSNIEKKEENNNKTTGGVNGYGVKLTNIFSNYFEIETVDIRKSHETYYNQKMKDNMGIIEKPTIATKSRKRWTAEENLFDRISWSSLSTEQKKSHTTIKYFPDYKRFGYKLSDEGLSNDQLNNLERIIKTRLYFAATYIGRKNKIYFNNELIPCHNLIDLSKMMILDDDLVPKDTKKCRIDHDKYPWDVVVSNSDGWPQSASVINGIVILEGDHIKHIESQIVNQIRPKVESLTKDITLSTRAKNDLIRNNLFLMICGNIPNIEWNSQSKNKLTVCDSITKGYKLSEEFISSIWVLIKAGIENKFIVNEAKKSHRRTFVKPKNYDAAHKAGTKFSTKCSLYVVEGNSAMTTATRGIKSKGTKMVSDYFGVYSLGGVPINARKEIAIKIDNITGEKHILHHKKLKNNDKWTSFIQITGLDFDKQYEYFSPEECTGKGGKNKKNRTLIGDTEFSTLNYGRIIGLVDQDEDGKGQIWGLFLNDIALFWPHLFKRKWILRQNTPIIRVYGKSDDKKIIASFYNIANSKQWLETKPKNKYIVKYYKGLASNTPMETVDMMKYFDKHMILYALDKDSDEVFEIYYGKKTDLRKEELATFNMNIINEDGKTDNGGSKIVIIDNSVPQFSSQQVTCSYHLRTDTKSFQLSKLTRNTPHVTDGLLPVRRKILEGSRKKFGKVNKELKVFQLGGCVTEAMNYEHGDSSLCGAIINLAQDFVGARLFPLFIGVGEFGSRDKGGSDAGAPRYIKVKLNQNLINGIYPEADTYILEYVIEEGEQWEPKFYVPIIPMAILEDQQTMGAGWGSTIFARNTKEVVGMIRSEIKYWQIHNKAKPRKLVRNIKGDIKASIHGYNYSPVRHKYVNSKIHNRKILVEYSYGNHEIVDENTIIIKELPRKIWNSSYLNGPELEKCPDCSSNKYCDSCQGRIDTRAGIKNRKFVKKVKDDSTTTNINIVVKLVPGGLIKIFHRYMNIVNRNAINLDRKIRMSKAKLSKKKRELELFINDIDDQSIHDQIDDLSDEISEQNNEEKCNIPMNKESLDNAITYYFELQKSMKPNLNFIVNGLNLKDKNNNDKFIKSYQSYKDIFYSWFDIRMDYYTKRLNREMLLCKLRINMYENIIKFINKRNEYNLSDISKARQIKILTEEKTDGGYDKINKAVLTSPGFIRIENLKDAIMNDGTSYNYLLELNSLQMNKNGLETFKNKLQKEKDMLEERESDNKGFVGSRTWLTELNKLEKIIIFGFKNGWSAEHPSSLSN